MRFVVACLSLGFFSFLSFGVHTESIHLIESTDPNVKKLGMALANAVEKYGQNEMALGFLGAGIALSFLVIAFGPREDEA